jgi:hypothetical protein
MREPSLLIGSVVVFFIGVILHFSGLKSLAMIAFIVSVVIFIFDLWGMRKR